MFSLAAITLTELVAPWMDDSLEGVGQGHADGDEGGERPRAEVVQRLRAGDHVDLAPAHAVVDAVGVDDAELDWGSTAPVYDALYAWAVHAYGERHDWQPDQT